MYLNYPLINPKQISREINSQTIGHTLSFKEELDSTNTFAFNQLSFLSHGAVILTNHQTKGKGRLGRNWSSLYGKSIALSIVMKPELASSYIPLFTQLSAAALSKSLESFGNIAIKWPNDILLNGKKVAGILTESHFEGMHLKGVVIGLGINSNFSKNDFIKEIRSKATSLREQTNKIVDPNAIIISFLKHFDALYNEWMETKDSSSIISICKDNSILMNKTISIHLPNDGRRKAVVKDINEIGELIVQYEGEAEPTSLDSLNYSLRNVDGSYI